MKKCCFCKREHVAEVIDLGEQPVSHRFLTSSTEKEFTHSLILGQCKSCGLAQLIEPAPTFELKPRYDWLTCTEPEGHLDQLVNNISNLPGITKDSKVCGISFKEDTTLERFKKLGFANTWRIQPEQELGIRIPLASIETVQEHFTPEKVDSITKIHGQADVVIARHILEHTQNPLEFIEACKLLLKPTGYIVFEIPSCFWGHICCSEQRKL